MDDDGCGCIPLSWFKVFASHVDLTADILMAFQLQHDGFDGWVDPSGQEEETAECTDDPSWKSGFGAHGCAEFAPDAKPRSLNRYCSDYHNEVPSMYCPVACSVDCSGWADPSLGPRPNYLELAATTVVAVPCFTSLVATILYGPVNFKWEGTDGAKGQMLFVFLVWVLVVFFSAYGLGSFLHAGDYLALTTLIP